MSRGVLLICCLLGLLSLTHGFSSGRIARVKRAMGYGYQPPKQMKRPRIYALLDCSHGSCHNNKGGFNVEHSGVDFFNTKGHGDISGALHGDDYDYHNFGLHHDDDLEFGGYGKKQDPHAYEDYTDQYDYYYEDAPKGYGHQPEPMGYGRELYDDGYDNGGFNGYGKAGYDTHMPKKRKGKKRKGFRKPPVVVIKKIVPVSTTTVASL